MPSFAPPTPRLVACVEADGNQSWRAFEVTNQGEALIRASRQGLRLRGGAPGIAHWDRVHERFEYRDSRGRTLLELEDGGRVEFIAVGLLHRGEIPAPVTLPTMTADKAFVLEWLVRSGEYKALPDHWAFTDFACPCGGGVIQARKTSTATNCRCTSCG
ncbi:MAG TPA: hypothetical protein VLC92_09645 [Rhodocyclaceae bacterium]|nr:hypothetical protein [Rhodocyclaceae bacterium]